VTAASGRDTMSPVETPIRPATAATRPRRTWVPHQHGAWAMLAVPLLLGVAASRPSAWHLLLGAVAITGYLASATGQAWLRARRRETLTLPLVVHLVAFGILGLVLVAARPVLLAGLVVLVPTTALITFGARPGTRRDLANSLAQAAQALVLVPAAALVADAFDPGRVAIATAVTAAWLLGTVLVVRSMLRERDSVAFAGVSAGYHAVLVLPAALLGPAWAILVFGLAVRAAALPAIGRRRAAAGRPLKPIHVGLVELVAAVALVVVAFLATP
jgi:hypothetical protein